MSAPSYDTDGVDLDLTPGLASNYLFRIRVNTDLSKWSTTAQNHFKLTCTGQETQVESNCFMI